jgi:2-(1,2-epoxy-1,2-dihydrophenyl)acetyl-CoA isomerase
MPETILDRITYDVADGVGRIELSRPEAGNSLDQAMGQALRTAARRLQADAGAGVVRVGVIAARGKAFSVGGDLREFAGAPDRAAQVRATADELHAALAVLGSLQVPLVSVIQGTAAGGGLGIALAGDIVIAASEARLVMAYTASGLTPDCGLTWIIPRRVSWARAMDLALANRALTGAEAAAWGLVSRAVPAADLAAEAGQVISTLRRGPAGAFAAAKRLMAGAHEHSCAEEMDAEAATIARMIVEPDGVEGIDAFLAKRSPAYR